METKKANSVDLLAKNRNKDAICSTVLNNVLFFSIRTVLSNSELVNTGIGLQGIGEQDRIWARVSKVG